MKNCLNFNYKIKVDKNPLNLKIEDYLSLAVRNNNKRRFLFISKNLGKHLPSKPEKVDELGNLLSKSYKLKYPDYSNKKQIIIGFAETATCLAHSFFNYLESAQFFIHTTREETSSFNKFQFSEYHSHAVKQNLYVDNLNKVKDIETIILVDDEITTAQTCINIIREIKKIYNVERYVIASILNWINYHRTQEIKKQAQELKCDIEFVYLFNGNFEFELDESNIVQDITEEYEDNCIKDVEINHVNLGLPKSFQEKKYLKHTGRFGITRYEHKELIKLIKDKSNKLQVKYKNDPVLALGIEEFMYIPMMFSRYLQGDVYYHSTTRSPIMAKKQKEYPVTQKYEFKSFYNENVNYIYNLKAHNYKECFLFTELENNKKKEDEFIKILKCSGIKRVNLVKC